MRHSPLLAVPFALAAGCYSYASVDPGAARPGTGVRARVTAPAAERLAPLLSTSDARVLIGTLIENEPSGMIIEVPTVAQTEIGSSVQTLHQRVSVARGDLVELETRQLDRGRTALVVGASALIAGSVLIKSLQGQPGSDKPPTGGSTDTRLPH